MIAALYVEKGGVYFGLPDVDPWDEERDARTYAGPHSVVAHPPCAAWCAWAGLRERDYGLPAGEDGGCFEAALRAVRTFGGVLEHPARSKAWATFGLPRPIGPYWAGNLDDPGWVIEIDQAVYGHPSRKLTWLYLIGPPHPLWTRQPLPNGRGPKNLSRRRRSATPLAFRDALLAMAQSASLQRAT